MTCIFRNLSELAKTRPKQSAEAYEKIWTEEEITYAVDKLRNGADLMTVASDLGRSESGLREKLIREGYTFNKRMINSELPSKRRLVKK